jgi:hypothetical protein
MDALRQPEERTYQPGERVPSTGIYGVYHLDHQRKVGSLALITEQTFPECEVCGSAVRYQLEYAAPHILEDDDFHPEDRRGLRSIPGGEN